MTPEDFAAVSAAARANGDGIRQVLAAADTWLDAYATGIDGPRLEQAARRLAGAIRTWRASPAVAPQ